MSAALMIQGTGSDVGKSLLVAGLARAFSNRGLNVMPFKPQNMSNNAAVTTDGGEIGRAQALQARAARKPLLSDMNPVLLKPQSDMGAQIILQGRVWGNADARTYQDLKPQFLNHVLESFHRLRDGADLMLVEGAGSPAEINLRQNDIANMGFAEAANVPVLLAGDIDRGGIIAQIVGTVALLSDSEKARLKGYVINKFRGDRRLFDDGLRIIGERTGLPSFGVLPYFDDAHHLPPEDAFSIRNRINDKAVMQIAIPVLSRIANFDDFDPLIAEPGVNVHLVRAGDPLPPAVDLVILPGSKATLRDMDFLRDQGWDIDIHAHLRQGGSVLGICAGYQMLGQRLSDPCGYEGPAGETDGLGLLAFSTTLNGNKMLLAAGGTDCLTGTTVHGYHMHLGHSVGTALTRPFLELSEGPDGVLSADGRIMGTYLHGLFASDLFRHKFISRFRKNIQMLENFEMRIETTLDALAVHMETHLDLDHMLEVAHDIT